MARLYLFLAAVLGGTGVVADAFASHALRGRLEARALGSFETAARYQLIHALALLAVALLLYCGGEIGDKAIAWLQWSSAALILGVLLFSGSLYGLSLGQFQALGWVTPLGGLSLILGWGMLAIAVLQLPQGS